MKEKKKPSSQEKGDALENAVHALEEVLFSLTPGLREQRVKFARKKTIKVRGISHEIDVHVTVNEGQEYEAIYIFECKNRKTPVDKNTVIVFSKVVEAANATWGCVVAKSFTSGARNQAKQDSRVKLRVVNEHDVEAIAAMLEFFEHMPHCGKLVCTLIPRNKETKSRDVNTTDAKIVYRGSPVNIHWLMLVLSRAVCIDDMFAFRDTRPSAGRYPRTVKGALRFTEGQLLVDDVEIESASFDVGYIMVVEQRAIVSYFEMDRGRVLQIEPSKVGDDTYRWQIVMNPKP